MHPDDLEDTVHDFHCYWPLAEEAFRRFKAGQVVDGELYPADATHDRIWREQKAIEEGQGRIIEQEGSRVLIRNLEGLYLARDEARANSL